MTTYIKVSLDENKLGSVKFEYSDSNWFKDLFLELFCDPDRFKAAIIEELASMGHIEIASELDWLSGKTASTDNTMGPKDVKAWLKGIKNGS